MQVIPEKGDLEAGSGTRRSSLALLGCTWEGVSLGLLGGEGTTHSELTHLAGQGKGKESFR